MTLRNTLKTILESKLAFLGSAILGILIANIFPEATEAMGELGDLFVDLTKMCVLPIIITSISISVAYFMRNKINESFKRVATIFLLFMLGSAIIGTAAAVILEPGRNLEETKNERLKEIVKEAAQGKPIPQEAVEEKLFSGILNLILKSVPANIFEALAKNSIFQIVVFSIVFGIALGKYIEEDAHLMHVIRQLFEVFSQIFEGIIYIFPIIFALLMARDVHEVGAETLIGLGFFIAKFASVVIVLFIISQLIIMYRTKSSVFKSLGIMWDSSIIALATQSTTAAIPPSMMAMKRFHYDENLIQLLIPIGSLIGRFGNIAYFGFCAVFAMQLYGMQYNLIDLVLICFMAIIAGISTAAQTGFLSLSAVSLILTPAGIPVSGVLTLMSAADLLIDPIRTLAVVHTNCAAASVIGTPLGGIMSEEEVVQEEEIEDR